MNDAVTLKKEKPDGQPWGLSSRVWWPQVTSAGRWVTGKALRSGRMMGDSRSARFPGSRILTSRPPGSVLTGFL